MAGLKSSSNRCEELSPLPEEEAAAECEAASGADAAAAAAAEVGSGAVCPGSDSGDNLRRGAGSPCSNSSRSSGSSNR